ncbi:MAG: ribbon-helix-helix protein, CopG family [Solirubrobacterales bacterium]
MKVLTVRIDEELATELHAVARAEDVPVSEAIRAALHQFIADRMADPQVRRRLQKRLEEDCEVLERMGRLVE